MLNQQSVNIAEERRGDPLQELTLEVCSLEQNLTMAPDGTQRDAKIAKRFNVIFGNHQPNRRYRSFRSAKRRVRRCLHKLVLEPKAVRDAGARKLHFDSIGRSRLRRMWLDPDHGADLIGRDVEIEPNAGFRPE